MSCHGPASTPVHGRCGSAILAPLSAPLRVLLVGGPNVGKSTLFDALAGARQHTTNAPGTTVELATGTWRTAGQRTADPATERVIVDLPGSYSLLARSSDEQVTADAVRELAGSIVDVGGQPGVVVVVLDATALTRSLYLLAQVAETGVPLVVALTMLDLASKATDSPTAPMEPGALAAALATSLGVPVLPVNTRNRGSGGLGLADAVDAIAEHPMRVTGIDPPAPVPDLAQELAHAETLFAWVEHVVEQVTSCLRPEPGSPTGVISGRRLRRTSPTGSTPSCSTHGPAYQRSWRSSGCCSSSRPGSRRRYRRSSDTLSTGPWPRLSRGRWAWSTWPTAGCRGCWSTACSLALARC